MAKFLMALSRPEILSNATLWEVNIAMDTIVQNVE